MVDDDLCNRKALDLPSLEVRRVGFP
jgi:hypothetical protein